MVKDLFKIKALFETSQQFGSLFIVSDHENQKRVVVEVKNVNDGLAQVSFIPLGDEEKFEFSNGDQLNFINEANNISFSAPLRAIHSKSWITVDFPRELRIVNLRTSERFELQEEHLSGVSRLTSYGDSGVRPLIKNEGRVLEISESGASFQIDARAMDGYYKGDHVELMVSEKFPFLSQVKGKVVHKIIGNMMDKENRFYRVGIKFNKKLNLSPLNLS